MSVNDSRACSHSTRKSIFKDGIVCDTRADSIAADAFLDDVITRAMETISFNLEGALTARRLYTSHIDVELDANISRAIKGFDDFGKRITAVLRNHGTFGQEAPEFSVFRLGFHGDYSNHPGKAGPQGFSVERRDELPYSENRYFTTAPLSTPDHLSMLVELEGLLQAMANA